MSIVFPVVNLLLNAKKISLKGLFKGLQKS